MKLDSWKLALMRRLATEVPYLSQISRNRLHDPVMTEQLTYTINGSSTLISVLARRLDRKGLSEMIYSVSSGRGVETTVSINLSITDLNSVL